MCQGIVLVLLHLLEKRRFIKKTIETSVLQKEHEKINVVGGVLDLVLRLIQSCGLKGYPFQVSFDLHAFRPIMSPLLLLLL